MKVISLDDSFLNYDSKGGKENIALNIWIITEERSVQFSDCLVPRDGKREDSRVTKIKIWTHVFLVLHRWKILFARITPLIKDLSLIKEEEERKYFLEGGGDANFQWNMGMGCGRAESCWEHPLSKSCGHGWQTKAKSSHFENEEVVC